jgi:heat shock protein HslJ
MKRFFQYTLPVLAAVATAASLSSCITVTIGNPAPVNDIKTVIGQTFYLQSFTVNGQKSPFSRKELESIGMGEAFTLTFNADRVSGEAAPNRYFGPYNAAGDGTLKLGPLASTLMAALKQPPDLTESAYMSYLNAASKWRLIGNVLEITSGDAVLTFTAP